MRRIEDSVPSEEVAPATTDGFQSPASSRRRFLRGSVAASPVILTVVSRPVGATNCVLASSFVSRSTMISRNGGSTAPINCTSNGLTYWRNFCASQPTHPTLVKTVATYLGCSSSLPDCSRTVKAVIEDTTASTTRPVLQRILVMCLNIDAGFVTTTSGFSKVYLASVWTNYAPTQTYTMAGGSMDSQKLAQWLDYLMNPISL